MEPSEIRAAAEKYAAGMAGPRRRWEDAWEPYRRVLARLKLPRRGKRNSKANWRRAQKVAIALHAEKLRLERDGQ
jgi:hypothetical protein